jgi:hypothetical protein
MTKKQFIAYVEQDQEGCGYNIDCAKTLWKFKASTLSGAIEEAREKVVGTWDNEYQYFYDGSWEEDTIDKLTVFEVSHSEQAPLKMWYEEASKYKAEMLKKVKDEKELRQYEKLKKKYG